MQTEEKNPITPLEKTAPEAGQPDGTEINLPDLDGEDSAAIIEAVLFAAGHPLEYAKIAPLFGTVPSEVKRRVGEIAKEFNRRDKALVMLALDDCAQLCTREEFSPMIREALGIRRGGNLSNSSIETLSIIAYNQPVTRVYIDSVRGVDSSYAVSSLLERGLIECVGRLDQPGRPMLYGTTPAFLRCFGLSSLAELPEVEGAEAQAGALSNVSIDEVLAETEPAEKEPDAGGEGS